MAKKLIKSIYPPQQAIIQVFSKEKIFIITKRKL